MSVMINCSILSKHWMTKNAVLASAVRTSHWMKDYKPGPYPRTEKEMRAAADKYGISYSEYKPYPDDGRGLGDYPNLPLISAESKDPFYPWDHPELKRNFSETLHAEFDLIREDRYDISLRLVKPMWFLLLQTFGTLFTCAALYYVCDKVKMFPAVLPKQYPIAGKKHFSFEPCPPPPPKGKK